jgi:DNA-directed RNA polymerase specialized sigma subunit
VIQEKGSDYTAHVEGSDIPNEAPGLEEMMKFDQRAFLQGVLSQMPERDREILAARFFGQHDNA